MSYNNKEKFEAKAPYRFVPLSKKIVSPHWADAVSHDVPFEDGLSGSIEVELTAHSDIFVSNGKQSKDDPNEVLEFSNFEGKHFIPATSLKGMVRNVMEIMSFGGMKSVAENNKYAFRDLRNNDYLKPFKPDKIFCGYLTKSANNEYMIKDCGIPGRISQLKIDDYFNTTIAKDFDQGGKHIRGAGDKEESAVFKNETYRQVTNNAHLFNTSLDNTGRQFAEINSSGNRKGKIVFTGQPGVNNLNNSQKRNGKNLEFVFFEDGNEIQLKVDKEIADNFKFAYFDQDKTRWSYDWRFWRNELRRGNEIPVFFHKGKKGEVIHLGLSYLYKLPYKHSIHDMINHTQKTDEPDLCELIFGNIRKKDYSLKGRVSFSHAWLTNDVVPSEKRTEVLASPKASYYPFYIKQSGGKLVTYMDSAEVAGWKKYPIHKTLKHNKSPNGNEKIAVKFKPLPKEASFKFRVSYHNLRKVELGALLSAMTLHRCEKAFHSIGMAKPLGYGKIKLNILDDGAHDELLRTFEAYMTSELDTNWCDTIQIKEFLAMSSENESADEKLAYMDLKAHPAIVKQKDSLKEYSADFQGCKNISLCDENQLSVVQDWLQKDKEKLSLAGSVENVVYEFQKTEEQKLEVAFHAKKKELIEHLKQERIKRKQQERAEKDQKLQDELRARATIIKSQTLAAFIGDKKNRNIKEFKNYVETYSSKKYDCKRNSLSETYPEGYIQAGENIQFIEDWLVKTYQLAGKKNKKEFEKPFSDRHPIFKEVTRWVGVERSKNIYKKTVK